MNPPFNEDLVRQDKMPDGKMYLKVSRGWISWFTGVTGNGASFSPTVGGSPFTYQNTTNTKLQAFVIGGTVSSLQYSRNNVTFFTYTGPIVLGPGDYLKITYTVLPTLTVFPI